MFGLDLTILGLCRPRCPGAWAASPMHCCSTASPNEVTAGKAASSRSRSARTRTAPRRRARVADAAKRKKSVQDSLKELEAKQRERSKTNVGAEAPDAAGRPEDHHAPVRADVGRCRHRVGRARHVPGRAAAGVARGAGIVGGFGLPRWMVARMRKRRMNKFLEEFPNAVDVIVRGVRRRPAAQRLPCASLRARRRSRSRPNSGASSRSSRWAYRCPRP